MGQVWGIVLITPVMDLINSFCYRVFTSITFLLSFLVEPLHGVEIVYDKHTKRRLVEYEGVVILLLSLSIEF